ncbi:AraC family transcriptional regulator [Zunongwangia sp. F260]|uniref:AraC family transcriptional regulator n=1 Tax=Autumnicola lenta TaxID=3075593 RepID=A0ABU3CHB2_9FLAO|nr:AraC family transcriptional regulator [Zunongwangia sp. F260]MDT0645740.1 AraC family transcriptional regulator [Zunongwangia sp. F260]
MIFIFNVGFASAAYLSTTFKKATGLSPSQYKTQHLNNRNTLDSV